MSNHTSPRRACWRSPDPRGIAVDLFAGAGGMSLGFEQAGFDILASVEIDPIHCATHQYNFPFWTVICQSITQITGKEIRQLSTIQDREIDVIFGGPPCQGFSIMGKRMIDDPRNHLIDHFIRLVLELSPKYFVMENVPGLARGNHKILLQEIIDKFIFHGYCVQNSYKILNSAYFGVPQNRERLFLIGSKQSDFLPDYPQLLTHPKEESNLAKTPTVREAIADLPEVNNYPELEKKDWISVHYETASLYAQKLRGILEIENDLSYPRNYDINRLTSSLRTCHTAESIKRFQEAERGRKERISRFYKLSPEGLCNTLRAGTPHYLGSFTAPRPIHYSSPRCITVREAARLHSYPDWFRFHVTKWHGFRQIGNSVPPFLAKAIAQEIIKKLEIKVSKPTETKELGEEKLLSFNLLQAAKYYGVSLDKFNQEISFKRNH